MTSSGGGERMLCGEVHSGVWEREGQNNGRSWGIASEEVFGRGVGVLF